MAGQLSPLNQKDFSGGENSVASPYEIGPKQVARLVNMILDEHGSLRTVDGTKIQTTAPAADIANGRRIMSPATWATVAGVNNHLVISARPPGFNNILYNIDTNPWTALGTFTGFDSIPQLVPIIGFLYISCGNGAVPSRWDGAAFSAGWVTPPPGAEHMVSHEGFLWVGNTNTISGTDGPSVVRQSDLNDPTTWNAARIQYLAKDDNTQIQGMSAFTIAEAGIAPLDTLVIFKDRTGYQITGNMGTGAGTPSSNFTVQQVKSDMGCIAPRTIQFVAGYGIIRFTHKGFALFDGVEDRLISEEIRTRLLGRDTFAGVDMINSGYAWAGQIANPPLYICLLPTNGINMTMGVVYDLVRRSWAILAFPFSLTSISSVADASVTTKGVPPITSIPKTLITDATLGNIRRWFAQDPDWDGTPIAWSVQTAPRFVGSPTTPAYWRRLVLDVTITGSTVFNYTMTFDDGQSAKAGSVTVTHSGAVFIDIDRVVSNAYVTLSGTGVVKIREIEWQARSLPLGRRGL